MTKKVFKRVLVGAILGVVAVGAAIIATNIEIDTATIKAHNNRNYMDATTTDGYYVAYNKREGKVGDTMHSIFMHRPFSKYDDDECLRVDFNGGKLVFAKWYNA